MDDTILPSTNMNMKNGQIFISKDYIGPISSVSIGVPIFQGLYEVIIKDTKGRILDSDSLSIYVTQWGKIFPISDKFKFKLENNVKASKLKPIIIRINKNVNSNKNISVRSITVRKIEEAN